MIICIFVLILGFDLCHSACTMVGSAKHGELFLSEGGKMLEKCEGLARFEEKKTGKMFCLKKKGKMSEKLTCVNCQCGQENKPSSVVPRVVGGTPVQKNQFPWYSLVFTVSASGENYSKNTFLLIFEHGFSKMFYIYKIFLSNAKSCFQV